MRCQIVREHPDTIASHFGHRPIGVAVVHEPLGPRVAVRKLSGGGATNNSDEPIGTQPSMPIAQPRNICSIEVKESIRVRHHDEIVTRPVSFS